jgi:hypothetical protein
MNLKPNIVLLEVTDAANWQARECHLIAQFKAAGANLLNMTEGGEGGATWSGKTFSAAHRRAISEALKGHKLTAETAKKIGETRIRKGIAPHNKIGRLVCSECGTETNRPMKGKCQRCYDFREGRIINAAAKVSAIRC